MQRNRFARQILRQLGERKRITRTRRKLLRRRVFLSLHVFAACALTAATYVIAANSIFPESNSGVALNSAIIVDYTGMGDVDSSLSWFSGSDTAEDSNIFFLSVRPAPDQPRADSVFVYFDASLWENISSCTTSYTQDPVVPRKAEYVSAPLAVRAAIESHDLREPLRPRATNELTRVTVPINVRGTEVVGVLSCTIRHEFLWSRHGDVEVLDSPGFAVVAAVDEELPTFMIRKRFYIATNEAFFYVRGGTTDSLVLSPQSTYWDSDRQSAPVRAEDSTVGTVVLPPESAVFSTYELQSAMDISLLMLGTLFAAIVGIIGSAIKMWVDR